MWNIEESVVQFREISCYKIEFKARKRQFTMFSTKPSYQENLLFTSH